MNFDSFRMPDLARSDQSKLMNGSVVPRRIAWLGGGGLYSRPTDRFTLTRPG